MRSETPIRRPARVLTPLLGALLLLAFASPAAAGDDTDVFQTRVPPNVLLVLDNSGSMMEIMYHPDFDPSASTCSIFGLLPPNAGGPTSGWGTLNGLRYYCDSTTNHCRYQIDEVEAGGGFTEYGPNIDCGGGTFKRSGYYTKTFCGNTRKLYVDGETLCTNDDTWWSETYLEWYFSDVADSKFLGTEANSSTDPDKIDANDNGVHYIDGTTFPLFKRTRIIAAKEIARDVIYQTNSNCGLGGGFPCPAGSKDVVRFGVAQFDTTSNGPGGFVTAPIDDYSVNATTLDVAIGKLNAGGSTPLAETLFKTYTYFMSRTTNDRPYGSDATTRFPKYQYRTSDGRNTSTPPGDPLECPGTLAPCPCQKNFAILITDGYPTRDNFSTAGSGNSNTGGRTVGFTDFVPRLIGDYHVETPTAENDEPAGSSWLYLDDVAKWMHEKDMRLDLAGDQTLDVYTVGFATAANTNALLTKAANVGGGKFYSGFDSGALTNALIESIADIIRKSQSFTASTVPAARTSSGGGFYTSEFIPYDADGYWEGHLKAWKITAAGEIHDKIPGNCALDDPTGNCLSGPFLPTAQPFWDAGEEVPAPGSRKLFTSVLSGVAGVADQKLFLHPDDGGTLQAADLGVLFPPALSYPNMGAGDADELTAEIIANVRGCAFGTGANGVPCTKRNWLLGDIFHSQPVVIPGPSAFLNEPGYDAFHTLYDTRKRVIVGGSNDGFLHVFDAGTWVPALGDYDQGTGVELGAFMPYTSRQSVQFLAVDSGTRSYYHVDGAPTVADVWLYSSPTIAAKKPDGSEWRTMLVGGMRQGGRQWYALDVTNPNDVMYPNYQWEFPREDAPAAITDLMGETWAEPIITRVRVAVGANDNGGQGFERWVAIVTGGYDMRGDPNSNPYAYDPADTHGRAIMMIDLESGELLAMKAFNGGASDCDEAASGIPVNDRYNPFDPEKNMCFSVTSTPGVYDLDGDGFADVVFVGDLGGNVWKWVIEDVGDDPVNDVAGDLDQPNWPFKKFFKAPHVVDAGRYYYKSFFAPPSATLKNGKLWLAFGSGERADLTFQGITGVDENNRFYAITDLDPLEKRTPVYAPLTEPADLVDLTGNVNCVDVSAYRGYYLRGVDGEKFVTQTDIFFYNVFVGSFKPAPSTLPCDPQGEAFLYAFKIYCGEGAFDDGAGNPVVKISLADGMPADPKITISSDPKGNRIIVNKQDGTVWSDDPGAGFGAGIGQFYWRELDQ